MGWKGEGESFLVLKQEKGGGGGGGGGGGANCIALIPSPIPPPIAPAHCPLYLRRSPSLSSPAPAGRRRSHREKNRDFTMHHVIRAEEESEGPR